MVLIEEEAWWAPEQEWTFTRRKKSCPSRDSNPGSSSP